MTERKRKSKISVPRTEVFGMRLDPKLKYLSEIASRRQRRSLANYVEWAMERALNEVPLNPIGDPSPAVTVANKATELWALDEATRLVNLAILYPDLLTYEEQLIWNVICQYHTWTGDATTKLRFRENGLIHLEAVQECWKLIKSYALGTATKEQLDILVAAYDWMKLEQDRSGEKHG